GPRCKLRPAHLKIACRNIVTAALIDGTQDSLYENSEEIVFTYGTDEALSKDVEVKINLISSEMGSLTKDPREEIQCALMLVFKSNKFSIVFTPSVDVWPSEVLLLSNFTPSLCMRKAIWRTHEEIEKI